jgi:hypothetical protein
MRTITRATLALSGAAALTLFAVVPANAVDSTDTVTVAVAAGVLTITTGDAVSPTGVINPGSTQVASIAAIDIDDARAATGEWVATASATAFANANTVLADSMADAVITYTAEGFVALDADAAATGTVAAAPFALLPTATNISTATFSGNNTAAWDADLSIDLPAGALAGTYTTVVTHSVL